MTLEDVGPDNWRHSAASRQDRLSQKVRLYDSDPPPPPKPQEELGPSLRWATVMPVKQIRNPNA